MEVSPPCHTTWQVSPLRAAIRELSCVCEDQVSQLWQHADWNWRAITNFLCDRTSLLADLLRSPSSNSLGFRDNLVHDIADFEGLFVSVLTDGDNDLLPDDLRQHFPVGLPLHVDPAGA